MIGYMDFNTLSLKLPGGLSFSLMRYWDGQVGAQPYIDVFCQLANQALAVFIAGYIRLQVSRCVERVLFHCIRKYRPVKREGGAKANISNRKLSTRKLNP